MDRMLLVVDDDENICKIIGVCIENFSPWRTTLASSGEDGFLAIASVKPDAILLDMMMPFMDGFDFLKQLQSHPEFAQIPVIILTSRDDLTTSSQITQLGVKGAIVKPFDPLLLVYQIVNILGWSLD
jgi:DNA-binding response OmpR family regulator